ncbi:MAG: hypothetical protein K2N23_00785, partial [Clostridia bacterium]|nr:hypothetical protein [Clostridia bacterium]
RTCDVDGCDKPVEREAHVWGDNDKCEKCGVDKPDEPNPEHKHNYTYTDNGDGTHTGTCAVDGCDAPTLEPEEHVWGANNTCACGAKKPNDRPAPAENTVSFVFDRVTGSALYADAEALNAAFEDACNDLNVFGGVTETANVYANTADAGSPALKFGTSKALGSVTLSFERTVAKVVINCKAWSGDSAKLVVNGAAEGTAKDVPATQGDVEFDLGANASNTITIASYGSTSKNRCFIYSITVTFKVAQPLNAPELDKLDEYGVITWKAVDGAAKYAYRIGDGEVNYVELTEDRKVTLADGATIKVWAVGDGFDYIVDNEERALTATYTLEQVTLSMADVTEGETVKEIVKINKSTGKVSWSAVKGAVKYVYTVKDNEGNVVDNQENVETDVPVTTITLGANYSITIKAIGDGTVYLDSAEVTKTRVVEPTTLDAPEVLILRDGTVKIKNTDAVSFSYSIDGGTAVPVDNNHDDDGYVVLTELMKNHSGKAIAVTSIGNGNEISDSETPTSKTYVAPATFTDVEVDFAYTGENKHEVTVSWFAVTGATAYEYAVNGTALQNVEATTETVEGNTKYTITITLAEDDVFTLTVVGDEVANEPVIAGGDYSSKFNTADIECAAFEIDNSKVYSVAEIIEVMNYYGMVANDVTSKDFKVKGVVTEIASTSGKPFAGYYVTDGTNGRAFEFYNPEFDESKVSADIIAIKEQLVHYSVTAEGKLTIYGSTKEFKNSCTIIAVALEEAGASEMAKGVLATAKTALTAPTGTAGTAANTVEYTLVSTVGENNVPVTWDTDNITVAWDEETTDELGANIVSYADGKLIVTLQDHKISVSITANLSYTVAYDGGSKTETDSKTFTLKLNAKGDNSEDPEPEPHSFDLTASFANGYGSSAWGSSYGAHTVYITDTWGLSGKSADSASALGTIKFANANQQSSNITDCPVFKSGENGPVVELYNHTITSVTFTLKQWTTKTYSSIEIKYSTDGINWSTSGNLHTTNASTLGSAGATKDFSYNITDTGVKYVRVVVGGANQIGVSAISLKVLPVA